MSRFTATLRGIHERLDLPEPDRSRIVLEIAADLEDLYEALREQGLGEEEAARRAEETLDLGEEALAELVQIHRSLISRLLGRISAQAQTRWERALLTVGVIFIASYTGRALVSADLLENATGFVWPVLGISLATLALAVFKAYDLYIKKDCDTRRLRAGIHPLLAGGLLSLLAGLVGTIYGAYRAAVHSAAEIERAVLLFVDWSLGSSALMIISLDVAIAAGIVWFVLMNRARSIEMEKAAWLLE